MDEKPKQPDGWNEAFDRVENEKPEKPVEVLNARQVQYIAHLRRNESKNVLG